MITYDMRDLADESLYEYLYRRIREDILSGRLKKGERMPSKRSFAKNQGVAVITVENAYAQLVAEGYLYSEPRRGFFVSRIDESLRLPQVQAPVPGTGRKALPGMDEKGRAESGLAGKTEAAEANPAGKTEGAESDPAGKTEDAEVNPAGEKDRAAAVPAAERAEIDLAQSRVSPDTFPFNTWAKLLREILQTRRHELLEPAPGAGLMPLRSAIAAYLLQYLNLRVSPDQIVIGAGTEYLYSLLIRLLGPELVYAVELPGYPKTGRIYESNQVCVRYIPMDSSGICVDALRESGADVAHISPSHQFPTGITMPIGRRSELLSWCRESGSHFLIEDDYDSEFRLSGRLIPPIMSIEDRGRVIYMNTFTKSLASTIRISYMVLPPALLQRYREKLGFYSCTVPSFEQYVLAEFIGRGYYEKHINRMRNYYRQKRNRLLHAISGSGLRDLTSVSGAEAGLHFLLLVKSGRTEDELTALAAAKGVRVYGLSRYMNREEKELRERWPGPCMVVNFQGLSNEAVDALPELLEEAWFS